MGSPPTRACEEQPPTFASEEILQCPRGVATRGEVNVTSPHGIEQGSVRKDKLNRSGVEGERTAAR
jgi:hypothetical protein